MMLEEHLERQARACENLGSPFTAQLLRQVAAHLDNDAAVLDRMRNWPTETLSADAVSLRLAGGLHALVLVGKDTDLAAAYQDTQIRPEQLWPAVEKALTQHQDHLMQWLESPPQTNEVRRAPAMILAAFLVAEAFPDLPLRLSELGASAGLNLNFDRFSLDLGSVRHTPANAVLNLSPEWQGIPPPPPRTFEIAERRGVDLNPLSPSSPEDVLRLRSYIWADQPERLERTDAALAITQPVVDRGDAGAWLKNRLAKRAEGMVEFIYSTVAWQYFPEQTKSTCRQTIQHAAAQATDTRPVAWLSFEVDETGPDGPGAPITLRLWPGDRIISIGRMDFHGRWVQLS